MAYTALIFDNRPGNVQTLAPAIRHKFGYRTVTADTVEYGIRWIMSGSQPQPDLILIDFINSGMEIVQVIQQAKACKPQLPIIVMMQYGNDDHAVPTITAGANDFLIKPVGIERLRLSIQNALKIQHMNNAIARLERKHAGHVCFSDLIGQDESFKNALRIGEKAANGDLPVWIDGEQGTGRESLARAIHGSGGRAGKPFIAVDCENLKPDHAESVLFGVAESSGGSRAKTGRLQAANQGTLYCHEITCLPTPVQQRLLNAIAHREVKAIGSSTAVSMDIRIICSNSKNTGPALAHGALSNVLHDRLRAIPIQLPALRNRREDIAALAQHFLNMYAASENRFPAILSEDTLQNLKSQPWPGNLRQLGNLLHQAALLSQLDQIDAATLRLVQQFEPVHYGPNKTMPTNAAAFFDGKGQVKKLRSIENEAIRFAVKHANGCMTKAAQTLGIGRSTLYRKIDEMEEAGYYMSRENQTTRPTMPASAGELS